MPTQTLLPSSKTTDAVVNLLHLKLFHHFQTCTYLTLLIAPEVWLQALQLSFQFEFLMNAILCVAARHLAILQPEDLAYPTAAESHLCRALSLFRHVLSNSFTSIHIDAFIATSVLLQYEVWTSTDFISCRDGVECFDPSRDRIFTLSSGLKQVFLETVPLTYDQPSVFLPQTACNGRDKLVPAAQISNSTLAKYQRFFSYYRPLGLEQLNIPLPFTRGTDLATSNAWQDHVPEIQDALDPIRDGYVPIITHLCLILSFLPEARLSDSIDAESPLLLGLGRYIFTFPVLCRNLFASMVQQSDPHTLLLLYHFYRAVRILLPKGEYWWAHKRAAVSETVLKKWLTSEIAKQALNDIPIHEYDDLYNPSTN